MQIVSNSGTFTVDLRGVGTMNGLAAQPATAEFGDVPTGQSKQLGISVQNTGTTVATITGVTVPAAGSHFTVGGAPAAGGKLQPQQSVTLSMTFTDTTAETVTATVIVAADTGSVTIPLSARSLSGNSQLVISPKTLDFGRVALGTSKSATFTVSNGGTIPLTITKAAPPTAPFDVPTPIGEGQKLQPGEFLTITVVAKPVTAAAATGVYLITGDDGQSAQQVAITMNPSPSVGAITNSVRCLDIRSGSSVNGTVAQLYSCNGSAAQRFTAAGDGTMRVLGKCLRVSGAGTAPGTAVELNDCTNPAAQQWRWRGDQTVINVNSALCLAPRGGQQADGVSLVISTCSAAANQKWDLAAVLSARGQVRNPNGLCMDVRGSSTAPGSRVQQAACTQAANQLAAVPGNGTVQLLGQCLDTAGGATAQYTPVVVAPCTGAASQQWSQGTTPTLVNVKSGRCLDIPGNVSTVGRALDIFDCNATTAQRWALPTG